jgi:hypothetical protein
MTISDFRCPDCGEWPNHHTTGCSQLVTIERVAASADPPKPRRLRITYEVQATGLTCGNCEHADPPQHSADVASCSLFRAELMPSQLGVDGWDSDPLRATACLKAEDGTPPNDLLEAAADRLEERSTPKAAEALAPVVAWLRGEAHSPETENTAAERLVEDLAISPGEAQAVLDRTHGDERVARSIITLATALNRSTSDMLDAMRGMANGARW